MTIYPSRLSPEKTEYLSTVKPPHPIKHVYAACKLIGSSDSPSPSSPVSERGHLISKLPLSRRYSASSGSNHTLPALSAFPIDPKCEPLGLGTYTQASGCAAPVPVFLDAGAGFLLSCAELVLERSDAGPSGAYTPIILSFGWCSRGCAKALCIAFLEAERMSAWYTVGFGSKSFSPRRGILAFVKSPRLGCVRHSYL